jgi:hypothetical protein
MPDIMLLGTCIGQLILAVDPAAIHYKVSLIRVHADRLSLRLAAECGRLELPYKCPFLFPTVADEGIA